MRQILDYKIEMTWPAFRTLVQFRTGTLIRMTYTQMIGTTDFFLTVVLLIVDQSPYCNMQRWLLTKPMDHSVGSIDGQ